MLFGAINIIALVALTANVVNGQFAPPGYPHPYPYDEGYPYQFGQPGFVGNGFGGGGGGHGGWGGGGHHKRDWHPEEVNSGFQSCQSKLSWYSPRFETACHNNHPEVLVNGLVDIRTSIVGLSASVHAGIGAWGESDIHSCATQYVGLLAKVQTLLEIIHSHNQIGPCGDSINNLNVPLRALTSAFVGAKVDLGGLLGAQVNLNLLGSLGISLGISAKVNI